MLRTAHLLQINALLLSMFALKSVKSSDRVQQFLDSFCRRGAGESMIG